MKNDDEKGDLTIIDYRYESRIRIGKEIDRKVKIELELFELISGTLEFQRLKQVMEEHTKLYEESIESLKNERAIKEAREKEVVEAEKLGIKNEDMQKSLGEIEASMNKRQIM